MESNQGISSQPQSMVGSVIPATLRFCKATGANNGLVHSTHVSQKPTPFSLLVRAFLRVALARIVETMVNMD